MKHENSRNNEWNLPTYIALKSRLFFLSPPLTSLSFSHSLRTYLDSVGGVHGWVATTAFQPSTELMPVLVRLLASVDGGNFILERHPVG